MLLAAAGVNFQEILSAQNLLSPQAFILYALAFLGIMLWIAGVLMLKGKSRRDLLRMDDSVKEVTGSLSEVSELVSSLHDGFSSLADEFKFFKEKVMVKLNSNARVLEMMPKIADSLAELEDRPAPSAQPALDPALAFELEKSRADMAAKNEKIRQLELEMANFHKIMEGRSLEDRPETDLEEERGRIRLEREELAAEKTAFRENQERVKSEIQMASDRLRDLQEKTREERKALEDERKAIEEEKAEITQTAPAPADRSSFDDERSFLSSEIERLKAEIRRLSEGGAHPRMQQPETAPEPPLPEPAQPDFDALPPAPAAAPAAPPQPKPEEKSAPAAEVRGINAFDKDGVLIVQIGYPEMKRPEAQEMIDLVFSKTGEKGDKVLLDFSRTKYVNSSGMSAITKVAVERNCQIVLTNRDILKVIDLMGFLPLLNINETFEEAVEAFSEAE